MLDVGLDPALQRGKRPHQFSGGQCQRISIARAVVTDPKLIICDEPVSALDVSVQAQILNLLEDMKTRYGLTLIFIAHDLAVVKNVSDRVVVMYLGKICEVGTPDALYKQPSHPYTAALLAAIPVPDPNQRPEERPHLGGEIPSPVAPPSGCRFRTRCPKAQERCASEEPEIREIGAGPVRRVPLPAERRARRCRRGTGRAPPLERGAGAARSRRGGRSGSRVPPCTRRAARDRRRRRRRIPLRLDPRRVPRCRPLLRPLGVPHHLAPRRRTVGARTHRSRRLLGPPRPPLASCAAVVDRRVARRRAGVDPAR